MSQELVLKYLFKKFLLLKLHSRVNIKKIFSLSFTLANKQKISFAFAFLQCVIYDKANDVRNFKIPGTKVLCFSLMFSTDFPKSKVRSF